MSASVCPRVCHLLIRISPISPLDGCPVSMECLPAFDRRRLKSTFISTWSSSITLAKRSFARGSPSPFQKWNEILRRDVTTTTTDSSARSAEKVFRWILSREEDLHFEMGSGSRKQVAFLKCSAGNPVTPFVALNVSVPFLFVIEAAVLTCYI